MKHKSLSDKRMDLYRKMCSVLRDFKWGLLFDEIKEQDKQSMKRIVNEIILESPDSRHNLIKLKEIVGEDLT
ncbi:MAG TPA: hypothetical protein ENG87_01755 [Candidatus Pacearchaeota archaeon]|nr:hypothetical protein [Candidatus Pacearchaeota archaeon]HDZ60209.1 hypothetical protein [Candidatus Pacearchaeota archaeon]